MDIHPEEVGIEQSVRAAPIPEELPKTTRAGDEIAITVDVKATAMAAADAGMAALSGEKGATYDSFDSLVYTGALILNQLKRHNSLHEAADQVRSVLDSGVATARVI